MTDRLHSAGEEGAGRMQGGTKKELEREREREGQWSEKLKKEWTFFDS